jgi:putative ABC transport system ATP-binding protein
MTDSILVRLRAVDKVYESSSGPFKALADITLDVAAGEFVAVVGRSGSGKSTLVNLVTGIDRPSRGEVIVGDVPVHTLDERSLSLWRGKQVGVVFQFFQLLPTLTIAENVMLPMDFCNTYPLRERSTRALALLERVGIADQADKLPASLSGGQQQRAAVARALANNPRLVAADEPTGNLDSRTSEEMLELFAGLARAGTTVIMVTHERDVSRYVGRQIRLVDGALQRNGEAIHA